MMAFIGDLSLVIQRDYSDGMWMENYRFKSGTFFRMFWDLCFYESMMLHVYIIHNHALIYLGDR